MEKLLNWDHHLLLAINSHHSVCADFIMGWASDRFIWIPLYIFMLYLLYKQAPRKILFYLGAIALLILLVDQSSVHLFKIPFARLRPCHTPGLAELLHLPQGCGGQFGFISSHAANSFALATFLSLILRKTYGLLFLWAALVAYSRVYLGVHFFSDILAGALWGSLLAYLVYLLVQWGIRKCEKS